MSPEGEKVRLGGMALQNGIMVHSYAHWAAAVRGEDGRVKLASGEKPDLPAILTGTPILRGVARMAEVAYLLPLIRRRLPDARLPMESPGMGAALVGSAVLAQVIRRTRLHPAAIETVTAGAALFPAVMALRGSRIAGYHGAEHKAIGGYEHDGAPPRPGPAGGRRRCDGRGHRGVRLDDASPRAPARPGDAAPRVHAAAARRDPRAQRR